MKFKFLYFIFSLAFIFFIFIIVSKFFDPNISWIAFPISLLLLRQIDFYFIRGYLALKNFSAERIAVNLTAAGYSKNNIKQNIFRKNLVLLFLFLSSFIFLMKDEIFIYYQKITYYLQSSYPVLRVEYPSYSNTKPFLYNLSSGNLSISLDSSSYMELKIQNIKKDDDWRLLVIEKNTSYPEKSLSYQLQNGSWSTAVQTLYSSFLKESMTQKIYEQKETKYIDFIITNKEKKFNVNLKITPVIKPVIIFQPLLKEKIENSPNIGKLNFKINVLSKVPLTSVEMLVRTKSGYNFKKTLAEFSNSAEFQFESNDIELVTMGIPFLAEDILYVKTNAKTVISDLIGESVEYEIPIKTPLQVRNEIIKNLEAVIKELNALKKVTVPVKENLLSPLSKSAQLAMNLSQSGVIRRNIIEAMNFVENMSFKNDSFYEKAKAKILTTLNILKRQQKMNEANNFLARLQNLKNRLFFTEKVLEQIDELRSETAELTEISQALNQQIKAILAEDAYPLSSSEKAAILNLLKLDKSAQKLQETEKSLTKRNIPDAQREVQKSLEEANNHLGFAMQLMQQARLKAIQEAKIKLNQADLALENSKYILRTTEVISTLESARASLEQTPKLGGEFNEFLQEAKTHARKTLQHVHSESTFDKMHSTQKAQEAVEKAILSLHDEEESDKDLQKEQDAHSYRSTMDILAAQSTLDSTWRKKILEEISKLKSHGEASDSAMIRYLESRLR